MVFACAGPGPLPGPGTVERVGGHKQKEGNMWKRVLSITIAVVFLIAIAAPDGALAKEMNPLS